MTQDSDHHTATINGPLTGIRVLDLSRVLAGPLCTQTLGDLGADIIKIEKPHAGDDTRFWGPPFQKDINGNDTAESAYYLSVNRNKKSVAIDITKPEGQNLILQLIAQSDIVIENFKVGGLKKYGLGYEQLKDTFPRLIYCAITGFGQNGPLATEPGYDFVAQAMSGFMSATGAAENGPTKAGVAISDVTSGLYAAIGILSALHHREKTGQGQMVDISLLDSTIAMMTNLSQYYLTSGQVAPRVGNAHSTIVPYQMFATADGHIVVAVGNDSQFNRFAKTLNKEEWVKDPRFTTNPARVQHRDTLVSMIDDILRTQPTAFWVQQLRDADVPVGPVNRIDQAFAEDQLQTRSMKINMHHTGSDQIIDLVGCPLKFSESAIDYRLAPPTLGEHTTTVLKEILNLPDHDINRLAENNVIGLGPTNRK